MKETGKQETIKENKLKKISRKDALKLLPIGLLAGLSTSATAAVLNDDSSQSQKKEMIPFKFASAEVPEYFYEFKVILTIFADKIRQETGFELTAIQPAKQRVRLQFLSRGGKELRFYMLPAGLEDVNAFHKGRHVEMLYLAGHKADSKKHHQLASLLTHYIDNFIETKNSKNIG